jgi:hypothetical protein
VEILSWTGPNGTQQLGDSATFAAANLGTNAAQTAFLGLPTDEWRAGLVPLFVVVRDGIPELRRRPPVGQEIWSEPMCFALPSLLEPALNAPASTNIGRGEIPTSGLTLNGSWRCTATRAGGSDAWFVWQLAGEGDLVSGRFDPGSDYRVAHFRGGTCRSNQVQFTVEYANESYQLKGELGSDGRMRGLWERGDREERGEWEARRMETMPVRMPPSSPVELIEWKRERDGARHYSAGPPPPGPGWTKSGRPIGRVWPPAAATTRSSRP